ncbi:hypothetical protein Pmani_031933 [Petrolisthes manimaculis]|uniref:Vezatin n=1 Tax=Petrolisthes manimaculis TaxID=1843537 RepID=A0AAE1NUP5_9EUCA|nr:hypothetical protein Pmani_031933 [Petrolisthes manimaculis]
MEKQAKKKDKFTTEAKIRLVDIAKCGLVNIGYDTVRGEDIEILDILGSHTSLKRKIKTEPLPSDDEIEASYSKRHKVTSLMALNTTKKAYQPERKQHPPKNKKAVPLAVRGNMGGAYSGTDDVLKESGGEERQLKGKGVGHFQEDNETERLNSFGFKRSVEEKKKHIQPQKQKRQGVECETTPGNNVQQIINLHTVRMKVELDHLREEEARLKKYTKMAAVFENTGRVKLLSRIVMEEDEDVVFEGSTLHQHLLATGYTDYEPGQLSTHTHHYDDILTTHQHSSHLPKRVVDALREKWTSLYSAVSGSGWLAESALVRRGVTECVKECGLLSDDDQLLLQHFIPQQQHNNNNNKEWNWGSEYGLGVYIMMVMMVMMMMWCSLHCTLFISIPLAVIAVHWYRLLRLLRGVRRGVSLLKKHTHVSSKCLRLLQELQLIQNGFVLAQGSAHNALLLPSPDTLPPHHHHASLYAALTRSLGSVCRVMVDTHAAIHTHTRHYPCSTQLFHLMPQVDDHCTPTQRLLFLKKWVAIARIQISTVLTEMLLLLHQDSHLLSPQQHLPPPPCLHSLSLLSHQHTNLLHKHTQELTRHYQYAKTFWFGEERGSRENAGGGEGKNGRSFEEKKKDVYIAVHSLSLHMQAALFRVNSLEKNFNNDNEEEEDNFDNTWPDKHSEYNNTKNNHPNCCPNTNMENKCPQKHSDTNDRPKSLPPYEFVMELVEAVRRELDLCRGCLEEAETRIDKRYGNNENPCKSSLQVQTDDSSNESITSGGGDARPMAIVCSSEEPVIEDEVFEAYIDHQEYDTRADAHEDDDLWNADVKRERHMMKQQREQGRRVLKELQPILTNRRKMWETRENNAINRQQQQNKVNRQQQQQNKINRQQQQNKINRQQQQTAVNRQQRKQTEVNRQQQQQNKIANTKAMMMVEGRDASLTTNTHTPSSIDTHTHQMTAIKSMASSFSHSLQNSQAKAAAKKFTTTAMKEECFDGVGEGEEESESEEEESKSEEGERESEEGERESEEGERESEEGERESEEGESGGEER